jgi:hypothetical protein
MKKPNPKHITSQPMPGLQLPDDWRNSTVDFGGNFDRRNLSEMWKQESIKKVEIVSLTRNARLQPLSWDEIYGSK